MGGKFYRKLNIGLRPIADKYHEGKVKRTLERELKVPEFAERKADGISVLGEIVVGSCSNLLPQRKRGSCLWACSAQCFLPCVSSSVHH